MKNPNKQEPNQQNTKEKKLNSKEQYKKDLEGFINSTKGAFGNKTKRDEVNDELLGRALFTVERNLKHIWRIRTKVSITYWVITILSIIMFLMGIILLSVPIFAAFGGHIDRLKALIAAGFGISDLVTLFLLQPINQIHKLMGDTGQIILTLDSFQMETRLRLLEMDITKPETIDQAADDISASAEKKIKLIQKYFEETQPTTGRNSNKQKESTETKNDSSAKEQPK